MKVFFDGEEAFINWSQTDSIYGSKKLASEWQSEDVLKNIKIFILLDLIGEKHQFFVNLVANLNGGGDNFFKILSDKENSLIKDDIL
jgi:glutaminyl-peptide cyclotransferase